MNSWELAQQEKNINENIQSPSASAEGGGFDGASRRRKIFKGWGVTNGSADLEVSTDIESLRTRSRDLEKNNHVAHAALSTKRQYVIGSGLVPEPSIDHNFLGMNIEQAEIINDQILRVFNMFANDKKMDWRERKNFWQKQSEVYHCKNLNGDAYVILAYEENSPLLFGTRLNSIEADRVSNPPNEKARPGFRGGFELDDRGRIKKLHIANAHPGSGKKLKKEDWQALAPTRENGWPNFLHIANKCHRAEQIGGVPDLTPIMAGIRQLGEYINAELLGSVIASKFTVFVKSNTPGALDGLGPGGGIAANSDQGNDFDDSPLELGDGLVVQLGDDEEIQVANPARPNPNFGPFIDKLVTHLGSALNLPYELLVKHFQSSYSASKGAMLMFANFIAVERVEMVRDFCRPTYEIVIDEAVATGLLNLPGYFNDPMRRAAYLQCAWHGAPMGDLDEGRAVNAAKAREGAGFSSKAQEARRMGNDFDQVTQRREIERKRLKAAGLLDVQETETVEVERTNSIDDEE